MKDLKKLPKNFNIHVAIDLRGEGIQDDFNNNHFLSFKETHKLASDESILVGYAIPEWVQVLTNEPNKMTKKEFKKSWSAYKTHYWNLDNDYQQIV